MFTLAGYQFTEQLLELERVSEGQASRVLLGAEAVVTPLKWRQWAEELEEHPDRDWVEFLVRGIRCGFRLGHDQARVEVKERCGAMYEASKHSQVISDYLEEEVQGRRVWRLVGGTEGVQCSPFGVIPKKGKPGKWRLIVNLSAPEGQSVNDGIDSALARVTYTSLDEVIRRILQLGRGARIAKADVRTAYRNVPVHPRDRWLLGMKWGGATYVDGTLPFGLRSAPLLFTALGDGIQWVAERSGAKWLRHYIDDFVAVGARGTDECAETMTILKEVCQRLGMPLDERKEEGPSEVLTFLGMELDTLSMVVKLPQDKLRELRGTLKKWRGMKSCRRRDLESIVGSLNHACKAVRPGRAFKRRLQDLLSTVERDDRRVRLNREAQADINWWYQFGLGWNGTALMRSVVVDEEPREVVLSDASGGWGCGAVWNDRWFQVQWSELPDASSWSIMPKELLPIVAAAALWGKQWKGATVKVRCDNMAVVAAIKAGNCKESRSMHLLRCLAFIEASIPVTLVAEHIRGVENTIADALSRDRLDVARTLMQVAEEKGEPVPPALLTVLTGESRSWSEQEWNRLLMAF